MTDEDSTRAGQPGRARWVGRARPPPAPPPPVDPYWPPLEGGPALGYPGGPPAGYPPPWPRRRRSGRTATLVVAGVLAACCAGGATLFLLSSALVKQAAQDATHDPARPDPTVPATPRAPRQPGLNTPVRDGKFEFVVSSVSCGHAKLGGSVVNTRAQGQFCVVSLSVANIGTEAQTFSDFFQKALGPDGTVYAADTGAGIIANEGGGVVWKVINPGITVTGKVVYDIPTDARIARLELHDSVLSRGITVHLPTPPSRRS